MADIAQGNAPLQSMMDRLLANYSPVTPPTPEERTGALSKLTQAIEQPVDTRAPIQAMMSGWLASKNPFDAREAAPSSMNALAAWEQSQRESVYKQNLAARKAEYEDMLARQKSADTEIGPMWKAQAAAMKGVTPEQLRTVYVGARNEAAQIAKDHAWESAEQRSQWIEQQAKKAVETYQQQFQVQTPGVQFGAQRTSPVGATPGIAPPEVTAGPEVMNAKVDGGPGVSVDVQGLTKQDFDSIPAADKLAFISALPPKQQEQALRWARQAVAASDAGNMGLAERRAAQVAGMAPVVAPPRIDKAAQELEQATGKETGKALGEEAKGLRDASAASSQLKIQLNTLKQLYTTPNMPEGKLGEEIQGIRSSLKSLGMEVGPEVAAADLASSIAGKMALLTRTAEGGNLMPGAMSDFEQKILRGLVPSLNSTAEGRATLIEYLSDMADVRIRLANEANKLAGDRGILPPKWYTHRDRVLKEEQARLAVKAREIAARFKGAQ